MRDPRKIDEELSILVLELDEALLDEKDFIEKDAQKKQRLDVIDHDVQTAEQSMAQDQQTVSVKTQEREALLVVITEMKTEFSLLNEQEATLESSLSMLNQRLADEQTTVDENTAQIGELETRIVRLTAEIQELQGSTAVLERERSEMSGRLEEISTRRSAP